MRWPGPAAGRKPGVEAEGADAQSAPARAGAATRPAGLKQPAGRPKGRPCERGNRSADAQRKDKNNTRCYRAWGLRVDWISRLRRAGMMTGAQV